MKLNENYFNLQESYLFATVAQKSAEYVAAHPEKKVIKLSIGDVTPSPIAATFWKFSIGTIPCWCPTPCIPCT